ncbi:amidohydrolase family protein [Niabella beijingensis]|uniref:amidohydrolase family protein n=1 Tax=Niabella beijingensis TaxID=2872700 RepID=UPI001CBE8C7A|nr:amidohydrolase family protein [Niabella beijingensis]MBZ4191176.1 amidohydrolase [Niabella beijingensis]
MLIDCNAYIGHWPFKQLQHNTCKALLQRMDQFGVALSLVSNLNGIFYKNTQVANEELYDEIRSDHRFGKRLLPFAIINPVYATWKEDLEICVKKMGMRGVRLYPHYHDYDITEPPVIELVQRARDLGVPVAFPLRMVDSRQRSWMDLEKEWTLKEFIPIVKRVPDARYLFLNIATGMALGPEEMTVLKAADFIFDTSGRSLQYMDVLLKNFGPEKFAFGTHAPILDYLTGLLRIESLSASEATAADKELLRSGNIRRLLKLEG